MAAAVAPFDRPNAGFAIKTFHGEFVDAVEEIWKFVGPSFPLIFIDPTGWTEYPFTKIAPLFALSKCPDYVVNRGHYFGSNLGDADKKALIAFLKTF